jgi:HlyD family secretion protein
MNQRVLTHVSFARRYIGWTIFFVVLGVLAYRWRFASVEAEVHSVQRGTLVAEVFGTGTLEAKMHAVLGAQISGRISEIPVQQGERVKAVQVLARLDSDELQRQLEMAQASLEAAKAGIDRLEADRQRAQAVLEQARRDHERAQALRKSNVQSESETEKSAERMAVAQADFGRTVGAVAEAKAQALAAEKTLMYHQARLGYATVKAPFDGLVILRHRDPGDIVVPGSSICELVATDVLWISAWVDESQMDALKPGQPARVVFRSNPDKEFAGTVDRLGRQVDRETREFVVDVRVQELPANWAIGQRAEVYIETERRENAVLLPQRLLLHRDDQTGVWMVREGAAHWQPVETGLRGGDAVEILRGLSDGDAVIATAQDKESGLREGRRVATK